MSDPTAGDFVLEHDANGQQIITPLPQPRLAARCQCVHHPAEPCHRKRLKGRTTCSTCRYFCG